MEEIRNTTDDLPDYDYSIGYGPEAFYPRENAETYERMSRLKRPLCKVALDKDQQDRLDLYFIGTTAQVRARLKKELG